MRVHSRQTRKAECILGNRVSNGLCVEQKRVKGEVVDVVALLVVVDVEGDTGLATKQLGLLLCLGHLGACKETARRDAVLNKGGVVGAAAELGGDRRNALLLEKVLKVLLDDVGAGGARQVEGATVAVVDGVNVVGGGNLRQGLAGALKFRILF
jgi:hypothetical protein